MTKRRNQFCGRTRREFCWEAGMGFGAVALCSLLGEDGFFGMRQARGRDPRSAPRPLAAKPPQFAPRAKHVIFLYMYGGPSHIETFDYKPAMKGMDGKTVQVETFGRQGRRKTGRIVEPRFQFRRCGASGQWVSELFPHLAECVDSIAFVKSMTADSPIHGSAMLQMNTGRILSGHPCLGSWIQYGLGTPNENLPGFVVMLDPRGGPISGAKNWSSGYMPATYQATVLRSKGAPILDLERPAGMSDAAQRDVLRTIRAYNDQHLRSRAENADLAARIASYELAYQMQRTAPEAVDLTQESRAVRALYGLDDPKCRTFGRQCLLARRLVERGVRFIQIYSGGAHNDSNWDAHTDIVKNHRLHAGETDRPIAGLLKDLRVRGLLDETLVVWGGEFGRQPTAEYAKGTGRDHNAYGFTMWLAGGGIRGGTSYGATDELGSRAVEAPCHVRRIHATILALLGIDPNQLSFFYQGLDQKLVGVEPVDPIEAIMA